MPDIDLVFHTNYEQISGQPGPAIQVIGRKAALDELMKGVARDGLVVRLDQPDHASVALEQSLEILRQKKAFPTNEELLNFAAQSPALQLVGGVCADDYIIKHSVQHAVHPPFQSHQLNIDVLLAFLRIAQSYHNQGRIYRLVVLTETYYAQFHVDVLSTMPNSRATHSIYLYRSFTWPGGVVVEAWRGFALRPGAKTPEPEVVGPPAYPQDLLLRVKRLRDRQNILRK